jgi:simple sugar transport system substrate-binding protein
MSKSGMFSTRKLVTVIAAGVLLTITACSSQGGAQNAPGAAGGGGGGGGSKTFTIAMVTHEAPGSTFWDRIRAGAEQAAKQHGIDLKYSNDPDSGKQATLIQNAIDSKVDAIAVTLANPDAVGPTLQKATQAGIPGTVFNSGLDKYQQYGALGYFGSDESLAGQSAGQRLAKESPGGKAICVVHEQGNSSLETRCAGVKQGLPNTENLQVNGQDLPSVQSTIQAKLAQDPSITDIVTLDAGIAGAAVQAQTAAGTHAKIVTFDLSPDVVQAIKDKKIEFSVDQQPYLQAYLAVDSLWLYLINGNVIGGGKPVLTGPAFVDSSNIDAIATYAANNTR